MSYEVLIQENKNINIDNDQNDDEYDDCLNIENNKIIISNNIEHDNDIISCNSSSINSIGRDNTEIKYINKFKCNHCGYHLNKRRLNNNNKIEHSITSNYNNNESITSNVQLKNHEDDFINCIILFIAGFILFLPWFFTFHYLGSPYRKCRIIAIISICLSGLFFIIFTLLLSTVIVLVSNPELLTMLQKYWLENNYNHNYY